MLIYSLLFIFQTKISQSELLIRFSDPGAKPWTSYRKGDIKTAEREIKTSEESFWDENRIINLILFQQVQQKIQFTNCIMKQPQNFLTQ